MADDTVLVDAPVSSVFAVLSDPPRYRRFVVGNSRIRRFHPDWPDEGTEFHHSLGIRPLVIRDTTTCLATDGESYLVLLTRMGFLGASITSFALAPEEAGTRVEVREEPMWGLITWTWSKLVDVVLDWRNRRLLARLSRLAEEQFARERSVLPSPGQPPSEEGTT